ncbi:hypothetical protein Trydic_g768 [Trypoxylus dichotomus]
MGKKKKKRGNSGSTSTKDNFKQNRSSPDSQDKHDHENSLSEPSITGNSSNDMNVDLSPDEVLQETKPGKSSRGIDKSETTGDNMKDPSKETQKHKRHNVGSKGNETDELKLSNSNDFGHCSVTQSTHPINCGDRKNKNDASRNTRIRKDKSRTRSNDSSSMRSHHDCEASTEYSLGHCVAEDMNMGSGIAVLFRREFKRVDELLNQRRTQGHVAILEDRGRFIYYLVTKRASTGKPTYFTLWSSLQEMKDHIITKNVKKLALPRIGCGLDALEWKNVKNMLEYIFQNVDVDIVIYNFQQDFASSSTPQPKLRKCNVVNILKTLSEIESGTIMIYFGSEDGFETEEIKDLSKKFPYIRNTYRLATKTVGEYINTERHKDGYVFYGCIVRKKHTDPFSFVDFQKCLRGIQNRNRRDKYYYIAFQAFMEDGSDLIVSKIINLMRYAMTDVDVYVCWPENLSQYMPFR